MGRIHVLEDHLVNRIAAGEVVERPASVVKELLENSLDAGSTSVEVHLEGGGKRLVRVIDDGRGMGRDDALLALERHATSKLREFGDLDAIATLGFRGEALPSIAAVSRFVLRTSESRGSGVEIEVRAGRILAVRETGVSPGTTIEVDRLFHNVPARRKFLRADNTELSHCVRYVNRFALANPGVRFELAHGSRTLIEAPRTDDARVRIRHLFGPSFAESVLPFRVERNGLRIHGFAGRPVGAGPRRTDQHLFVNRRVVQDRVLTHAIVEAYGNTVPRGHHTAMILFVEIDSTAVDVNVHPQKTEVRFRDSRTVHDAVRDVIRGALSREEAVPHLADLRPAPWESRSARSVSSPGPATPLREPSPASSGWNHANVLSEPQVRSSPDAGAKLTRPLLDGRHDESTVPAARGALAIAQLRDSYIIAQDETGMVVVDQHAAHERVLFERFLRHAEHDSVEVQRLAFPVVVELSPDERAILDGEMEEFRRLGILVEPFGGHTVRIDGVPAVTGHVDPERLLRELLGEAAPARSAASGVEGLRYRLITSAACQAAIKIHRPMASQEMQRLLDDLATVENPTTCPHGRPSMFRLTLEEIERAFRRR